MNNFLRFLLFWLIAIVLVDMIASLFLDSVIKHSGIRYSRMTAEYYDVAVLGNSRGVNSVNEEIFENEEDLEVLNLSHNGLSSSEILHLAKFLRDSATVYIEASAFLWSDKPSKSNNARFNVFKHLRGESWKLLSLSNYNHEIFLRALYYLKGSDKGWANDGVMTSEKLSFLSSQLTDKNRLNCDLTDFHLLSQSLSERGVRTIFYLAPMRIELIENYENWESCMSELRKNFPDSFIDLSRAVTDAASFADLMHTNNKEVRVIHKALLQYSN